jgi:hypothetical protein
MQMNVISQMVTQQITGVAAQQMAQRLGVSENKVNTALQLAIPLIVAGLARNAAQPQGADALHQAVTSDHDGSILDNLMGYLGNPQAANGTGILGHVLGDQQISVANNLAQATGIDQGAAGNLLEIVAPLVMGAVGRTQQQNGLDASGLSQFLGDQKAAVTAQPGMMGALSQMLDSNNDGSVVDDLSRIAGNFFK